MRPGLRKYVKAVLNLVTAVVLLCLAVFLLPRLLRFFMPFAVGWIIAMIANPLVRFCEQKIRIRRKAGSAIVIVAVLAGVILVGYLLISRLVTEAAGFVSSLPTLWKDVEKEMNELAASLTDFYELADPDMYLLLYDRAEHPLLARNAVWHTRLCPRCMEEQLLGGRTVSGQIERLKDCRSAYEAQVAQGAPDNGLKAFMDELENRTDAAEDIEEKETSSEEQELGLRFLTEQALKMTGSVSRTAELLDRKEDYIEMLAEQQTAEENRR